jgi:para-nitrobenzyl esterase
MVWLHPGGFEYGSANIAFNDGTNLARRGDVVVVALNQRLGPLGYLHLGELGGKDLADTANLGMLDLHLGLAWVRANIAAFGGDPDCVMVHGESGGARKAATLLAMPGARGLFHRVAIQSGPALRFPSSEIQTRRAVYTLRELGLTGLDLRKLQEIPVDRLVAAGMKASAQVKSEVPVDAPFHDTYGFAPMRGPSMPEWPFYPKGPTISANVPVLIGSNRHEMSFGVTQDRSMDVVSEEKLVEQVRNLVGEGADALLDVYRSAHQDASRRDLLLFVMADHSHRMDSIALAERKFAQASAPVYMYRFDWEPPILDGLIKAAHTYEIPFVFDNAQLCSGMTGGGVDAVALAARVSSAWIAFARTGNPSTAQLPTWPAYDTARRATMLFNDTSAVADDPGAEERRAWQPIRERRS